MVMVLGPTKKKTVVRQEKRREAERSRAGETGVEDEPTTVSASEAGTTQTEQA